MCLCVCRLPPTPHILPTISQIPNHPPIMLLYMIPSIEHNSPRCFLEFFLVKNELFWGS